MLRLQEGIRGKQLINLVHNLTVCS